MNEQKNTHKVGLIGTGMVGASFAYALMQRGTANDLVLIDADAARAEGEMMDLNHGMSFVRPMRIIAGDYADLKDADVIVICAGIGQRPGRTHSDLCACPAAHRRLGNGICCQRLDSRLLAVELRIPAVVGTLMGMDTLRAGMEVALDARRDVTYDQPEALIYIGE